MQKVENHDSLQSAHEYLSSHGFLPSSFWKDPPSAYYEVSRSSGVLLIYSSSLKVAGAALFNDCVFATSWSGGNRVLRRAIVRIFPEEVWDYLRYLSETNPVLPENPRVVDKVIENTDVANVVNGLPAFLAIRIYQQTIGITPYSAFKAFSICKLAEQNERNLQEQETY